MVKPGFRQRWMFNASRWFCPLNKGIFICQLSWLQEKESSKREFNAGCRWGVAFGCGRSFRTHFWWLTRWLERLRNFLNVSNVFLTLLCGRNFTLDLINSVTVLCYCISYHISSYYHISSFAHRCSIRPQLLPAHRAHPSPTPTALERFVGFLSWLILTCRAQFTPATGDPSRIILHLLTFSLTGELGTFFYLFISCWANCGGRGHRGCRNQVTANPLPRMPLWSLESAAVWAWRLHFRCSRKAELSWF